MAASQGSAVYLRWHHRRGSHHTQAGIALLVLAIAFLLYILLFLIQFLIEASAEKQSALLGENEMPDFVLQKIRSEGSLIFFIYVSES